MYQTAAHLPAGTLQHTTIRTHAHNSAQNRVQHFSHKWQSAILVAMQNVLTLLAMNRNLSNVQRHGNCPNAAPYVCSQINCSDNMHTVWSFRSNHDAYCGILYHDTMWSSTNDV